MKSIQIFDAAQSGLNTNPALNRFAEDANWATQNGAQLERFNLTEQSAAFADVPAAKAFMVRSGEAGLPLVLLDGVVALAGRYPTRAELSRWTGIAMPAAKEASHCCSGGNCG